METSARNPLSEKIFFVAHLFVGRVGGALALAALAVFPVHAQTSARSSAQTTAASPRKASGTTAKGTMIPRTPWGTPDLNGIAPLS